MLTRSSKHILKYQTGTKTNYLEKLFQDFRSDLKLCIDQICSGKQELGKFGAVENGIIQHSRWKQIIYKTASEVIRSQISKALKKRHRRLKQVYARAIKSGRRNQFTSKRFSELNLKPIHQSKFFTKPDLKNAGKTTEVWFDAPKGSYSLWISSNDLMKNVADLITKYSF